MTREEIVTAIRQCAEKLGRAPTQGDLARSCGVKKSDIRKLFGTHTAALRACGLERSDGGRPVSTEALFEDWAGIARQMGKIPSLNEYILRSRYSYRPIVERFGKWVWVPRGMQVFAEQNGFDREWADVLNKVEAYYVQRGVAPDGGADATTVKPAATLRRKQPFAPPVSMTAMPTVAPGSLPPLMTDRVSYGWPMAYSAMVHAPVNEMGVVYLFGAMAHELGFMVMRIQPEFPDCEAMRLMEGGRCQLVKIEFEWESVNFLRHLHDAKQADLIVCWKHNWKECPLEVVELSNKIARNRTESP